MKLDNAIALGKEGAWQGAQVRISPGSRSHWFVMLQDIHSKTFILADNDDQAIATEDLSALASMIRSLGLKNFTVFL